MMKRYKVILNIGAESYVQADAWVEDGRWIRFWSGGTAIAKYAKVSVQRIEDCTHLPCEPEYVDTPQTARQERPGHEHETRMHHRRDP